MTTTEKIEKVLTAADCEECFAVPGSDHIIDVINPATGLTWHYGLTLDEIRARDPEDVGAVRMTVDAFCADKAQRQHAPIAWTETTEKEFVDMLECLPPAAGHDIGFRAFLVGEPWDHDAETGRPRFAAYRQRGDQYETASRPMTREEFRAEMG